MRWKQENLVAAAAVTLLALMEELLFGGEKNEICSIEEKN
jgi:hypothetical protein